MNDPRELPMDEGKEAATEAQAAPTAHFEGDLGRRIAQRRRDLQLTHDAVADRARLSSDYLLYLEGASAAEPSVGTMLRLAAALETSVVALSGGTIGRPPGVGRPATHPLLQAIDESECRRLLQPGGVGRLVFDDDRGPVAIPVNFRLFDGGIVFRTAAESTVGRIADGARVGFEVDQIDEATSEGWSVLVSGALHHVEEPAGQRVEGPAGQHVGQQPGVEPWAGGARPVRVRLTPSEITGRRIITGP